MNDVTLPKIVKGDVVLDSLEEANNVVLPKKIGGMLCLNDGLKNMDTLVFPKEIGSGITFDCEHYYSVKDAKAIIRHNIRFPEMLKRRGV